MSPSISVVLHNIRSVYNVGAILRTCEGFGVERAIFSGYTPRYDDATLLPHLRAKLNHQISKSALGAETLVPQQHVDDLAAWLDAEHQAGQTIIGLENNLAPAELPRRWLLGTPIPAQLSAWQSAASSATSGTCQAALPGDLALSPASLILLLGEEVHGIPAGLRPAVDLFLEIPMRGRKESFNVSVATGIALWGIISASQRPQP